MLFRLSIEMIIDYLLVFLFCLLMCLKKYFTLILKDIFVDYRILVEQYFFFEYFKDVVHYLLSCIVSDKKSIILTAIFLYVECHFSQASFKIFPLSLVLSKWIMCLRVIFYMFLVLEVHSVSWVCGFIVLIKFENTLDISFQIFLYASPCLFFLSDSNFTHIGPLEIVPWFNDALFVLFCFSCSF